MQLESHVHTKSRVGFDPAHRLSDEEVALELKAISKSPIMIAVLDAAGTDMLVLNRQLQIVVSNRRAESRKSMPDPLQMHGRRLGEVYSCINAKESPAGCGAADHCNYCGALKVILSSLEKGQSVSGECVMRTKTKSGNGAGEFEVTATPIEIEERRFVVVSLNDISDQKRRELLERVFVHDLKNTLTGLIGWSDLLAQNPAEDTEKTASRVSAIARNIAEEIENHRLLILAESGQFTATFQDVSVAEILLPLKLLFGRHELAYTKQILLSEPIPNRFIHTDPAVLRRVLINMVTNALEATPKNGVVRIDFGQNEKRVTFSVWNEGVIPTEVAAHIFKRSFSTKAAVGRGLGTYSMKLFGEDVLGGKISFQSTGSKGTVFRLVLFET